MGRVALDGASVMGTSLGPRGATSQLLPSHLANACTSSRGAASVVQAQPQAPLLEPQGLPGELLALPRTTWASGKTSRAGLQLCLLWRGDFGDLEKPCALCQGSPALPGNPGVLVGCRSLSPDILSLPRRCVVPPDSQGALVPKGGWGCPGSSVTAMRGPSNPRVAPGV